MPLRLCSILGTLLLALSVTSPAFAKKKKGDDSSEKATSSSSSAKKSKKGKKGDDKSESSDSAASSDKPAATDTSKTDTLGGGTAEPQEVAAEPSSWERPPEEKEKPAAAPAPPPEKPKGSDRPISAALFAGWAFKTDRQTNNIGTGADPYGLGAGLRGGYSLDFHLYIGVYFAYFLGSSQTGNSQALNTPTGKSSASYMQFGAEAGYDWWVGPVIVRPSLEIGAALAFASFTESGNKVNKTVGDFMVGPGITVVHPWDNVFLGGEGRFLIVTGDGTSAFLVAATFGLRFE
jgi:hypothetical protein